MTALARFDTRRVGAAVAAALAGMAALGACGGGNLFTSGTVSGCFRTLPTAQSALHDPKARLLGVHLVPPSRLPLQVRPLVPAGDGGQVCAVAYKGTFAAGQVTGAHPGASGEYAVVLVDERHAKLLGSFVGARLPEGLRGRLVR